MFTGLVSAVGTVVSVAGEGDLRRIAIRASYDPATIALGASIACAGPCLTAVSVEPDEGGCVFAVDAAAETLARTTVGTWSAGTRINLERSLRIGDELGGHLVTGHVDGLAEIVVRERFTADAWGASERFTLRAPATLAKFIAEEGFGLPGRHLAHRERRHGRPVHGPAHPAHPPGHHLGRAPRRRSAEPGGRSDRPLRRPAGRGAGLNRPQRGGIE